MKKILNYFTGFSLQVWVLIAANFFEAISRFMAIPFLAIYLGNQNLFSKSEIGFLLGLPPLSGFLFGIFGGRIADRYGVKKVYLLSFLLPGITVIGFSFITNYVILCILGILSGLAWSIYNSTSQSLLAIHSSKNNVTKAFNLRYWFFNLGATIGPLFGAYIGAGSSALPIYIFSGTLISLFIILSFFFYREETFSNEFRENVESKNIWKILFVDKLIQLVILTYFFIFFLESQRDVNISQYLDSTFNQGVKLFANLIIFSTLIVIIFQPFIAYIQTRFDQKKINWIGSLLWIIAPIVFLFSTSHLYWYIGIIMLTFGEIIIAPQLQGTVAKIAPTHLKTTYFSMVNFAGNGAYFLGPWIGGILLELKGGTGLFVAMIILAIVSSSFFLLSQKYHYALEQLDSVNSEKVRAHF